jgi:hypothetical protein
MVEDDSVGALRRTLLREAMRARGRRITKAKPTSVLLAPCAGPAISHTDAS